MGEVVLITGCSRGIGLGLVDYFAKAGFKVKIIIFQFITSSSSEQALLMFGLRLVDDHVSSFETIVNLGSVSEVKALTKLRQLNLFPKVVATCRSPDKSPDLAKLLDKHGQAPALPLDTTNPASLLK